MSTDTGDAPDVRRLLLDEAARVLAERGPAALSARRLVKEVGASTMAVYTHFGSMPELVREVLREGFERFRARVRARVPDADPVADLARICRVHQEFARTEPDVYAVLLGGSGPASALRDDDRRMGAFVLRLLGDAIGRCADGGRFRAETDHGLLVRQLFGSLHGLAQLARAGYVLGAYAPDDVLAGTLRDFAVAAGDAPGTAAASVTAGLGPRP
ncbi:hypothetical protein SALBM135S_04721 [Streptomyces alboniger]